MVILTARIRRPGCPRCDMPMEVGRRQPHPIKLGDNEVVTFNCLSCRQQALYEMDEHGVLTAYRVTDR
jgi:RNase P subunit RPR2